MLASAQMRALGTGVTVAVVDASRLEAARLAVETELDAIDRACSRFRPDSELARLNRGNGEWVAVGPVLAEALSAALRAAALTDGLVDPTIGSALEASGYSEDFTSLAREGPALRLVMAPVPGWQLVRMSTWTGRVRIPEGVHLDLGATAKGLATDRAAAAAAEAAGCGVLVACGGDVAAAGAAPAAGWTVRVAERHDSPHEEGSTLVRLERGGLATSGVTSRRWRRGEEWLHHVIDPRSGLAAATPWAWVTVAAARCLDANIASTASLLLGQGAPAWLEQHGLSARLVAHDGAVTLCGGWPQDAPC